MSYPPQPPPAGPPGWGPPQGPPSGPPQGPPPGWGPPQGPSGWGPPGQPPYGGGGPKRGTGLIIGIVALVVLLVGGIVTTAVILATRDDDGDRKAGGDSTSSTSSTSGSTDAPSPTDASSATADASPVDPSSATPATPYSPTDDTGDDVHGDVKTSDFPGDWDFQYGDVKHNATLRDSWDYDSCGPVEDGSVFTQQRCEYAVQWSYSALGGKARVTHVFLVFDSERHAKAAEAKLDDKDLDLRDESVIKDFVQGKWNKSVYGNIVGVTVGTTNATVPDRKLQSLVNYMNTDYRLALLWKGF